MGLINIFTSADVQLTLCFGFVALCDAGLVALVHIADKRRKAAEKRCSLALAELRRRTPALAPTIVAPAFHAPRHR